MFKVAKRAKVATVLLGVVAVFVGVVSPAGGTPPQRPVTIETEIDFSSFPFLGDFVVTEGARLLGCSSGEFVDHPAGFQPPSGGAIAKIFTCDGPGEGDFVVNFQPFTGKKGPGDANGNWNMTSGTGDFTRLHGQGDFSVVFTGPDSGEETLTGQVHFD